MEKTDRDVAAGNFRMPDHRLPWYSAEISSLTDERMQILLCQRENVIWDNRLKKKFGSFIGFLFFLTLFLAIGIGLIIDGGTISLWNWLLFIAVPISGFLYKTFELWKAFKDVGDTQEKVNSGIQAEIDAYKKNNQPIPKERLQMFQQQIFDYRSEPALVPDFLFKWFKKAHQQLITSSTKEIIQEITP